MSNDKNKDAASLAEASKANFPKKSENEDPLLPFIDVKGGSYYFGQHSSLEIISYNLATIFFGVYNPDLKFRLEVNPARVCIGEDDTFFLLDFSHGLDLYSDIGLKDECKAALDLFFEDIAEIIEKDKKLSDRLEINWGTYSILIWDKKAALELLAHLVENTVGLYDMDDDTAAKEKMKQQKTELGDEFKPRLQRGILRAQNSAINSARHTLPSSRIHQRNVNMAVGAVLPYALRDIEIIINKEEASQDHRARYELH